jgi:small subunit ribosomal protein S20
VANNKSSKKRIEIAERNRLQNRSYKSAVRTLMKRCFTACAAYAQAPWQRRQGCGADQPQRRLQQNRQGREVGVLHRNTGAHQKSRLSAAVKSAVDRPPRPERRRVRPLR